MTLHRHALATALALAVVLSTSASAARAGEILKTYHHDQSVEAARATGDDLELRTDGLRAHAVRNRPVVGILLGESASGGARIVGVTPHGPAAEAGVRSGDVLVSVEGKPVHGATGTDRVARARVLLGNLDSQHQVTLGLARDGKPLSVTLMPRVSPTVSLVDNLDILPTDVRQIILRSPRVPAVERADGEEPETRIEVIRSGARAPCNDDGCRGPLLVEALRWNNLNLIALEPGLGRYFGTDHGVLVLSRGTLADLQAGDVIQEIEGEAVASPREAMQAMIARTPGEPARMKVMRDRTVRDMQVTVPERTGTFGELLPIPPASPAPAAVPASATPASGPATL
ncbi:MAG: PDZ domain-containing protein [Pseudoxanthomonas sp.]|nr:PDZ domain-containing protein [Pseudoxanthomonas sp.]